MELITSLHPTPKAWLLNSALAPHLNAFTERLRHGRYATSTTKGYITGIAHFARWMTQQDLPVHSLDEHAVEQFLSEHLPRCNCPWPVLRVLGDLRAALGHLLEVLREQGVVPIPPSPTGDIADELREYDEHMNKARGLGAGTRRGRLRTAQRLPNRDGEAMTRDNVTKRLTLAVATAAKINVELANRRITPHTVIR